MSHAVTPQFLVAKWKRVDLAERAACQEHFIDLCRMLGHPTPAEADPTGESFTFERGVEKSEGGNGWADVWKRNFFGWEYKGKHKDLKAAYRQLQLYRESLDNPPLLVVCDIDRIEVHTNFTGSAKRVYSFNLETLPLPENLDVLRKLFTDPEGLRPAQTTEQITVDAATTFAEIVDGWRTRGVEADEAAHLAMKILFCMFAEDIQLLPDGIFRSTIEGAKKDPSRLGKRLQGLFDAMAVGGDYGPATIPWFNGGLFKEAEAVIDLTADEIDQLSQLNSFDWASVEPSIFGTLFERTLDPAKRSQIGAHYTSREDIITLLEPVLMAPLRREWKAVQERCDVLTPQLANKSKAAKARKELDKLLRDFVERLATIRILDPACGSGNFLYVAINLLLDLEKEVIAYAARHGTSLIPQVKPSQLYGLEINPYAAELAQVVIWIGYLQWIHHNGFAAPRDPILEPIDTIRNMDAIIDLSDPDNPKEPEWPEADVIVGNPPFLGSTEMRRSGLDDGYVDAMRAIYGLPGKADLCCYWFEKARRHIDTKRCQRAGLLATQSIRHGGARAVLDAIKQGSGIFFAESNRPWKQDGAAVNISMIGFGESVETPLLDGRRVTRINADLTSAADLTTAKVLASNENKSFEGIQKGGPFEFEYERIADLLLAPTPHGRPCSDVLRPRANGDRLFKKRSQLDWMIDFGTDATEAEAAHYEPVFETLRHSIDAERSANPKAVDRKKWWIHKCSRPELRDAVTRLSRYVVTSRVAAHRLFVFLDAVVIPDSRLFAFAEETDLFFGIMSSRAQELWALRQGARHGDGGNGGRPTYNNVRCFETFPFPEPTAVQRDAIAAAAYELDLLRSTWLNPPEWTREEVLTFPGSVDGPWARYVTEANAKGIGTVRYPRIMPADDAAAKKLAKRTLTNLYNERPTWLDLAHKRLDEAVFAAYGWPADLTDDELLARLLALNLERAAAESVDPSDAPPKRPRTKKT